MSDPTTFEARLADAFERYVAPTPVTVNAAAVARSVASGHVASRRGAALRPEWLRGMRLAIVLALLALAAGLAILAAGAFHKTPPGPLGGGGRIFVATGPFHAGYVVKADGSAVAVGGGVTRRSTCPMLIAGGTALAVDGYGGLDLRSLDSASIRGQLPVHYTAGEPWSPDGRRIAQFETENAETFSIATPAADGTAAFDRIAIPGITWASWSDDSSHLAVAVPRQNEIDMSIIDGATGAVRVMPPFAPTWPESPTDHTFRPAVRWSHESGRMTLAMSTISGDAVVTVAFGSGSTAVRATVHLPADMQGQLVGGDHSWSRDGNRVLILTTDLRLVAVDLATGESRVVASNVPEDIDPRWSADGTAIAYRDALDLVTVGLGGEVRHRIPLSSRDVIAWSPDSQLVALVADAPGADSGREAAIWLHHPWDDSPRSLLARLDGLAPPDALTQTCLTWQPEAKP